LSRACSFVHIQSRTCQRTLAFFFFPSSISHWHDHPLPHRSQVLFGDLAGHTGKFFKEASNPGTPVDQAQSVIDPWVQ
jgi:hypothetical protein